MTIKQGDRVPGGSFKQLTTTGVVDISTDSLLKGKKVALFGLHAAQRWLVAKVDFAVTLVGRDHKAMAVAQVKQLLPFGQLHHRTGWIAGRADEQ